MQTPHEVMINLFFFGRTCVQVGGRNKISYLSYQDHGTPEHLFIAVKFNPSCFLPLIHHHQCPRGSLILSPIATITQRRKPRATPASLPNTLQIKTACVFFFFSQCRVADTACSKIGENFACMRSSLMLHVLIISALYSSSAS